MSDKDVLVVDVPFVDDEDDREEELDYLNSAKVKLALSVDVSCKTLEKLGLEQYVPLLKKKNVGVESLFNLGHEGLSDIGIKNAVDRASIIACGGRSYVTSDPPKIDGKPVQVKCKLGISRMARINTVELTCDVKFFLDFYWNDPSVIGVDPEHLPDYIWHPNAYVFNSIDGTGAGGGRVTDHEVTLVDSKSGLLLYPLELEVKISNEMDLRKFPFDCDNIEINILQSEDGSADDWEMVADDNPETSLKFFYDIYETPEWDVNGFSLDYFKSLGGNGVTYSQLKAHIHIRRRPMFYLWKLVLPLFLTTLFAFGAFFYPTDELEARSNTAATTLLTTVALIYVLSNELPKTNYQTTIDVYLVTCLVIQVAVWVTSNVLSLSDDDNFAQDTDRLTAIILLIILVVVTTFSFLPGLVFYKLSSNMRPPPYTLQGYNGEKLEYYPNIKNKNVFI